MSLIIFFEPMGRPALNEDYLSQDDTWLREVSLLDDYNVEEDESDKLAATEKADLAVHFRRNFESLLKKTDFTRMLFYFALKITKKSFDAEDLVQTTIRKIWEYYPNSKRFLEMYSSDVSSDDLYKMLKAYAYRMIYNEYADECRKNGRYVALEAGHIESIGQNDVKRPDKQFADFEKLALLQLAFSELSKKERLAMLDLLKDEDQLDFVPYNEADIAAIDEMSPSALTSNLSRARTRLRALFSSK